MSKLKNIFNDIISSIYPNKCICCGEIIDEKSCLCDCCGKNIERINLEKICMNCGLEQDDCVCKYHVFRFDSLVSVFKNQNLAQKIYYKYKFLKRQHYVRFFAKEICNVVNYCYDNIDFDFVCVVPSYKKWVYDHSGYIAKETAKYLNLPFDGNVLLCVKKTKKQHKSSIKDRLNNVDGKYCVVRKIPSANVLLIDDIKTTGATLDECAKELLFAGANAVYCVSVLSSTMGVEK